MNILVINSCSGLIKPESGGQNRFYNLISGLNRNNSIKALIPKIYRDPGDNSVGEIYYFTTNIGQQTFNSLTDLNPIFIINLIKILRKNRIDIIHISHPFGVSTTKMLIKIFSPKTKIIMDTNDVGVDLIKVIDIENYTGINKFFTKIYIFILPLIEKISLNCADHVLAVSSKDKKKFITKYKIDEDKIGIIPSGVNILPQVEHEKNESGISKYESSKYESNTSKCNNNFTVFFHGSYFHPPNRKAVDLIRNFIAPRIPEAKFLIAGYKMPVFTSDNVQSVGFVEDLYSLMAGVDLAITPITEGSGTRLKIMDYFMMELAVVSTKKGIEGIEAKNMENAIIVDDVDNNFIDAVRYLLDNPKKREKMGKNNLKLVQEKYDYQKISSNLNSILNSILSEDK